MSRFIIKKRGSGTLGRLIFISLITVLFFFKCLNFYSMINVGSYELPLTCVSTFFLTFTVLLIMLFSPRASSAVLATLYVIASVIMTVDLVYYSYMGKLPSFGLLRMAWQIGNVKGSVQDLISWRHILMLIDLPLWFIYAVNRSHFDKIRKKEIKGKIQPIVSFSVSALCAVAVGVCLIFTPFQAAFISSEFLCFHANDFRATYFPRRSGNVDKTQYIQEAETDNPYFGIAEGRNVFIIQVEALQDFVIDAEYLGAPLTPTMNEMIQNDSFYFENYYYQIGGGNTSDAEFAVNNSLFGPTDAAGYVKYTTNNFNGLPWILRDEGYSTSTVFHAYYEEFWNRNLAYPAQGFDNFISLEDFDDTIESRTLGISDRSFFNQSLDIIKTFKEPFYSFMITLSSHHPFGIPHEDRYVDEDNMTPDLYTLYVQSIKYFDTVLGEFIEGLKDAGLYENSIFVIYGDHYALTNSDEDNRARVEALIGRDYDMFERFSVPLIIHIPGLGEAQTLDTVGGHIDVLPTLLCLLGLENDKAVMFGHNLLNPDRESICYEQVHLEDGSFITNDVFFMNTANGINSVAYTKNGASEDISIYDPIVKKARKTLEDCRLLLDENDVLIK
ncbi:MAG: LTA synthase family protein [Clostridiales bacterium]|nr:LTA synthase family protein [Clostridiales bacterium]